jgi:hypothetical protein
MGGRETAESQQRAGNRGVGLDGEHAQFFDGPGDQDPMAGQDERPLRLLDHLYRSLQIDRGRMGRRLVAGQRDVLRVNEFGLLDLGVLADVDQDGPWAAAAGDVEGLAYHLGDFVGAGHQVVVLGDRQSDAGHIRLLESIASDQVGVHLAGDTDERGRVHHSGGNAGHQVRRARAGGSHGHADLTGGAGIAVGHMRGALLVPHQDVVHRVFQHGIIDGHVRPARVAKNDFDALPDHALPKNFRTCFFHPNAPLIADC